MNIPFKALKIAQVAEALGADRDTIYRLIHKGELKAFKVGSDWRITQKALEDYLKEHTYQPASTDTRIATTTRSKHKGRKGQDKDIEYWKARYKAKARWTIDEEGNLKIPGGGKL